MRRKKRIKKINTVSARMKIINRKEKATYVIKLIDKKEKRSVSISIYDEVRTFDEWENKIRILLDLVEDDK